jgi:hypothetical protein
VALRGVCSVDFVSLGLMQYSSVLHNDGDIRRRNMCREVIVVNKSALVGDFVHELASFIIHSLFSLNDSSTDLKEGACK